MMLTEKNEEEAADMYRAGGEGWNGSVIKEKQKGKKWKCMDGHVDRKIQSAKHFSSHRLTSVGDTPCFNGVRRSTEP